MILAVGALAEARAEEISTAPGTPAEGSGGLAGGATHGAFELRIRHYDEDRTLPLFPDRDEVFDYQEAVSRLSLVGGNDTLSLGLQGDAAALFSNAYRLDGELVVERDLYGEGLRSLDRDLFFTLEKLTLRSRGRLGTVELGDSYTAVGRGIALNLVKNTDIDIDTSLRGARADVAAGAFQVVAATGLANPQQVRLENPNVGMLPDLPHVVSAVRADLFDPVRAGVHGVVYQFARDVDPTGAFLGSWGREVDAGVVGAGVGGTVAGLDVSVEADYFGYAAEEIPVDDGYAVYGSMGAYPGPVSLLLEVKRYRDTEWVNSLAAAGGYEMAVGPSLEYERAITEDSSAAVNSNDAYGARLRADLSAGAPGSILSPYLSLAAFRDEDLGGLHFNEEPETIVHPVGGVLWVAGEVHLIANAGWRREIRDGAPADNVGDDALHLDASLAVPVAGPVSIELSPSVLKHHWGQNPIQQEDFLDASGALAIKVGSPLAVILYADYSDNPLVSSTGNVDEDVYGAVEVQWMPNSATTLKAFYGAYRAGIRCAGGQCRSLPGFDGGRLALSTNF